MFTFGLILAVALAGIGIGGLAVLADRRRPAAPRSSGFAATLPARSRGGRASPSRSAIASRCSRWCSCRSAPPASPRTIAGWTLVTAIVVLPAAIIAGYQFPLLIALFGRGRERLGRESASPTPRTRPARSSDRWPAASALLPWLSAPGAWRLVALVLVVLGARRRDRASSRSARRAIDAARDLGAGSALLLAAALASIASLLLAPPGRPRSGVTAASARAARRATSSRRRTSCARGSTPSAARIVWEGDGVESSVALAAEPTGYAFIVNGKSDGSARGDAGTQVMLGLLGALRHPEPRSARSSSASAPAARAGWLGADPVDGARRRRRARAADRRRRARVRRGQPRRAAQPEGPRHHRRRARDAARPAAIATTSSPRSRRIRSAPASPACSRIEYYRAAARG